MMDRKKYIVFSPIICVVLICFILISCVFSWTVTVFSESAPVEWKLCVIVDAGHGGVDGGATSCSGQLESNMNLQIALRLNDILRLLGVQTKMIRTTDISVYTSGTTIAAKKVSDLKERARIVNETDNAVLISIHMNHFSDSRYSGAQVFYAPTQNSCEIAVGLQDAMRKNLAPENNRQAKQADGIYLMQHISCPAVLVECGFISNQQENALLNTTEYQQKLAAVIAVYMSHNASCLTEFDGLDIIKS